MSERLSSFLGYVVKVHCDTSVFEGEIFALDVDTLLLIKARKDGHNVGTTFLGINNALIQEVDFLSAPVNTNTLEKSHSYEINKTLNVYTSATQPPIIKRGGPSSAVHRNLLRSNNTQENIHKSKSSNFTDHTFRNNILSCGSISSDNTKNDINRSRNSSYNDSKIRTRKNSTGNVMKEPSWMNYPINGDTESFDFDSNLALFNKDTLFSKSSKKSITEGSDSSDSGGIKISFNGKNGYNKRTDNKVSIEPNDFSLYEEKSFNDFRKSTKNKDVFSELRQMGIIPSTTVDVFKDPSKKLTDKESSKLSSTLLSDHCFLQQPDIIQEVTKSQLCKSDSLLSDHPTILSIINQSIEFQDFTEFWKIDNQCKFPVFSIKQREKLFECANKFGYDIRTIAENVGKSISGFVLNQIGGMPRLNGCSINKVSKVVVLLNRCQTSVFAAAITRYLVDSGCQIIVYYDDSDPCNDDMDMEIKLLDAALRKFNKNNGYNYLTLSFEDIVNKTFDYVITGLDCEPKFKPLSEDIIQWCFRQKTPILTINPNKSSDIPWKIAIFIGVPTSSYQNLYIRTPYVCNDGFLKPRSDGVIGLEIDKMFKKPDGLVLLCNVNLPAEVYNLLNLNFKSPFNSKNWIRLYCEQDLILVE